MVNDMICKENLSRNLRRYWVDNDSGIIVRKWTDEEYKTINPYIHIFEKYWSFCCPNCNFIPISVLEKEEAKITQSRHINHFVCKENIKRHKGFVEYRDHELVCLNAKRNFLKTLACGFSKKYITNKNKLLNGGFI